MPSPWQIGFITIAVLGAVYLAVKRRAFDIPALAYFAACFYFLPGFAGFAGHADGFQVTPVAIEPETYGVMAFVLVAIAATACLNDLIAGDRPALSRTPSQILRSAAWTAAGLGVVGMVMTVVSVGPGLFAGDKFELLGFLNRWHLLWTSSATVAVVLGFAHRSIAVVVMALGLLLVNLLAGFRVDLVIALVAVLAYWLTCRGRDRLASHWMAAGGIVLAAIVLMVLKYVLVAVQIGDVDLLVAQLQNPDAAKFIVLHSEPLIAQGTLNEVVRQNFWVGPGHLADTLYLLVPFATELGAPAVGFNALFQPALFSTVTTYGLGNNIWAEMLASGGWPMLGAFVLLYCAMLLAGDWVVRRVSLQWAAPALVVLAYWSFYIHRNDLLYQLTLMRRVLLVSFVILAVAFIGRMIGTSLRSLSLQGRAAPGSGRDPVRGHGS